MFDLFIFLHEFFAIHWFANMKSKEKHKKRLKKESRSWQSNQDLKQSRKKMVFSSSTEQHEHYMTHIFICVPAAAFTTNFGF